MLCGERPHAISESPCGRVLYQQKKKHETLNADERRGDAEEAMNADDERSDAGDQERIYAARKDHWKSRICRNEQLRERQGESESGYHGNNFWGAKKAKTGEEETHARPDRSHRDKYNRV